MAHLYRLISLFGLVFLLSTDAQAVINPTGTYNLVGFGGNRTTRLAACQIAYPSNAVIQYQSNNWYCFNNFGQGGYLIQSQAAEVCPANSTLSVPTNSCNCNATYTESNGQCNPPPANLCAELAGKPAGWFAGPGSVGPKQLCDTSLSSGDPSQPHCLITGTADIAAGSPLQWGAMMLVTGTKCLPDPNGSTDASGSATPPPDSSGTAAPTPCKPGQYTGSVNGTSVCVDPVGSDPVEKTTGTSNTTTQPDGTTVETDQERNTSCNSVTCTTTTTTTTTTTPPGGTPSTETTTTTGTCPRSSPSCADDGEEEPSSFGGSCGAAFVCDGDAILCSVALEQHKRNCALFVDSSSESTLYESEKGKTGPQYTSQTVPLGSGSFSQANALGASAQCIQDKVVTVAGSTITLPFSQICSTLQHLGTVLLFIAFLTAYRIVSRG